MTPYSNQLTYDARILSTDTSRIPLCLSTALSSRTLTMRASTHGPTVTLPSRSSSLRYASTLPIPRPHTPHIGHQPSAKPHTTARSGCSLTPRLPPEQSLKASLEHSPASRAATTTGPRRSGGVNKRARQTNGEGEQIRHAQGGEAHGARRSGGVIRQKRREGENRNAALRRRSAP